MYNLVVYVGVVIIILGCRMCLYVALGFFVKEIDWAKLGRNSFHISKRKKTTYVIANLSTQLYPT